MSPKYDNVSLAEALPREMARVRDEVLPLYVEIGAPGAIAATLMRADLDTAAIALAEGNTVAMIAVYRSLREWQA